MPRFYPLRENCCAYIVRSGNNCGGAAMAKRRRISDGATLEELQSLLLKTARQLRTLMPHGPDIRDLDRAEAELAWQIHFDTWLAANPEKRGAIVLGSDQSH
jgi:hypothetical protein